MTTADNSTNGYTVRRLRLEDAVGVVDCVRRVYGDSYIIHTELVQNMREALAQRMIFSGVAPVYLTGGDAIRLQYLAVDLDTSLLQIENPFARELLGYVERERERIKQLPTAND